MADPVTLPGTIPGLRREATFGRLDRDGQGRLRDLVLRLAGVADAG